MGALLQSRIWGIFYVPKTPLLESTEHYFTSPICVLRTHFSLSYRTAVIRSSLESPDPCAFNCRWNVGFRPLGADFVSFEVFRCARIRTFECMLNQSCTACLKGYSILFLKADNFGNINNKCCFQATKSLRRCGIKLCCWRSFERFSPLHWKFLITKWRTKNGQKSSIRELLAEIHIQNHRPLINFDQGLDRRFFLNFGSPFWNKKSSMGTTVWREKD